MPFDPAKYIAEKSAASQSPSGGFDPAKYIAEKSAGGAPVHSAAQDPQSAAVGAAVEGFGQGASLGYLPQMQAAAYKVAEKTAQVLGAPYELAKQVAGEMAGADTRSFDEKFQAEGGTINQGDDSYTSLRDENIKRQEALAKSNPKSYYGGMIAGGIATAPAIEMGVAKALPAGVTAAKAGLGARMLKAGATGAAMGAAANPGDKEGEISGLQLGDRTKNAVIGGAIGGGGELLISGVGAGVKKLAGAGDKLETLAEKNAIRAIGGQKTQMKALIKQGGENKVKEVGRFIIDNDLAPAGASVEDIAANVRAVKDKAGEEIGAIFDKMEGAGRGGTFDRKTLAQAMRDALQGDDSVTGSLHAKKVIPQLEELISDFESKPGAASAKELLKLKGAYDSEINYAKKAMDLPALQQGYKNIRSTIAEAIADRAESLSSDVRGQLGEQLKKANKTYSLASSASEIAENKLAQEGNNFFSLTDKGFGAAGAIVGGAHSGGVGAIPGAIAGAAAAKAVRTYGPSIGAKAIDAAAKGLKSVAPAVEAAGNAAESAGVGAVARRVRDGVVEATEGRAPFIRDGRPTLETPAKLGEDAPAKGEKKWANDGFKNLMEHGRDPASLSSIKDKLMADPEARQLLINASDLKPGSKALDKILVKLKERYGAPVRSR